MARTRPILTYTRLIIVDPGLYQHTPEMRHLWGRLRLRRGDDWLVYRSAEMSGQRMYRVVIEDRPHINIWAASLDDWKKTMYDAYHIDVQIGQLVFP